MRSVITLTGTRLSTTAAGPGKGLEADEFSGYIMQRLGASLDEAHLAMKLAANIKGSVTHRAIMIDYMLLEKGWNRASDQLIAA